MMKQTKYFLLMLAAMLFVACSDNDNDGSKTTSAAFDCSSLIGMSYSAMIKQYPNPAMQFGDYYIYENVKDNVEGLTIAINPETQTVYMVMETLKEGAYKEADMAAHFQKKFKFYGVEQQNIYDDDDNVTGEINVYTYGNKDSQEDATLVITLRGNESITYSNPKNEPAMPDGPSLDEMTPIEAANAFMLADLEEIDEDYPGVFTEMEGMYMCFMEENPWMAGVAFTPEEGLVYSITILYNDANDDQAIIGYYTEAGYECTQTGYDDDEEAPIYTIANAEYTITYCAGRGKVTVTPDR